jgi:hypothetical protein
MVVERVLERATQDTIFLLLEIDAIDTTGLTREEANTALAAAPGCIRVDESKVNMAVSSRSTQTQDPQRDGLLYVGREL